MSCTLRKLRYPLLGAALAALVLTTTTALAGSGVGSVFNLGQTNTVNGTSTLTGSTTGPQLKVTNASSADHALFARAEGGGGVAVYGQHATSAGAGPAVRGDSASTASSAYSLYGVLSSSSPGPGSAAVRGLSNGTGTAGYGVWGSQAGQGTGVYGTASTGSGIGVFGRHLGSIGAGVGVRGQSTSPTGTGVLGVHTAATGTVAGVEGDTNSTDSSAVGVLGKVTATSPGGFSAAVRGINNGTGGLGIGVYGSQAGSGWGVYGQSPSGLGVHGESDSGTAVDGSSFSGIGVDAANNSNVPALRATNNGTGPAAAFVSSGAPFTVNSSTKVENLNADQLDGRSANELVRAGRATNISYLNGGTFVERLTVSIDAPSDGFVLASGAISVNTLVGGATNCNPCIAVMRLRNPADSALSPEQVATFGNGSSEQATQLATSWVFPVTAGTRTFALDALATGTAGTVFFDNPTLTALFLPFGATGGATLGAVSKKAGPIRQP